MVEYGQDDGDANAIIAWRDIVVKVATMVTEGCFGETKYYI